MTTTRELDNRGMKAMARERRQKSNEPWLRAATEEGVRSSYAQQMAEEHSAVVELERVELILRDSATLKYRLGLANHGKDLSASALLVAILKRVDEVINE